MIYVLALNAKVAASWANINGITPKQFVYVGKVEKLYGVEKQKYAFAYGYREHPQAHAILTQLDSLIAHRGFTEWH